ncbi:hypothetical protein DB346_25045 [Verrucomicrobia bacterium LW23]|nr:hypothetical protein DB346_25045 [Verrucomicrobia bacterium LW23]
MIAWLTLLLQAGLCLMLAGAVWSLALRVAWRRLQPSSSAAGGMAEQAGERPPPHKGHISHKGDESDKGERSESLAGGGGLTLYLYSAQMLQNARERDAEAKARAATSAATPPTPTPPPGSVAPATEPPAPAHDDQEAHINASMQVLDSQGFTRLGGVGETMHPPDWRLFPLTALYLRIWPQPLFAECRQSPDASTLAICGEMDTPLLFATAFGDDGVLITTVGTPDAQPHITEPRRVRQSSLTPARAWHRHSATIAAWREQGETPVWEFRKTWAMLQGQAGDIIWKQRPTPAQREAYLHKAAFILGGLLMSLAAGALLALWVQTPPQ